MLRFATVILELAGVFLVLLNFFISFNFCIHYINTVFFLHISVYLLKIFEKKTFLSFVCLIPQYNFNLNNVVGHLVWVVISCNMSNENNFISPHVAGEFVI